MNNFIKIPIILSLSIVVSSQSMFAQETIRIMAYNLLEYWNTTTEGGWSFRDPYFRTVINATTPDIIAACELRGQSEADKFLSDVLNNPNTLYNMGTFVANTDATDHNVIYYKPSKFTFLSSKLIIPTVGNTNHPSYEYQLYNNLTGDKIVIYGIHFTSNGPGGASYRDANATTLRSFSDALPAGSYFIVAGDFNFFNGGNETAYSTLLNQTNSGYFLDPLNLPINNPWTSSSYYQYQTLSTRKSKFGGSSEDYGLKYISDLILNSQSVVTSGGVTYTGTYVTYGQDGQHNLNSINALPTNTAVSETVANALYYASDHLPVYADYTFDFPSTVNPPYPGSIVFTQVGATDSDVIEFMTLYRMNLKTLKITDNSINADSTLNSSEGTFDLGNVTSSTWEDVPGGTYVRLGTLLLNDNTIGGSDRLLQYNGTPGSIPYPSLNDIDGDQLIAYTGSSSNPTYIAGVNWGNAGWITTGSPTSGTSYAPGTLSDVYLGSLDNYYYSETVDDILYVTRDSLTTSGNWSGDAARIGYKTLGIGNSALPVELTFFAGTLNGSKIELRWRTETEVNNYGFDIERSSTSLGTSWETIGFVEGRGNSNSPKQYNFIDTEINQSGKYYYRLKQIDNDGTYEYSDIISVEVGVPNIFYLSQNYPNPFNPETRIDFTLPEKQIVSLRVYNILGEIMAELINEVKEAGSYSFTFDASNLPSGVYFYRLQTPDFVENKKMTLLR